MAGKKKWRIAIGLAAALAALALWLWMPQPLSVESESAGAGSRELLYEIGNRSFSPLAVGTGPWASLLRQEEGAWRDTGAGDRLHEDGGLSIAAFGRRTFSLPLEEPLAPGTYCLRVEGRRDGESVLLEKIFAVS